MRKNDLLERISINPNVCFGKPCIRGHRIWVSLILDLLADGCTVAGGHGLRNIAQETLEGLTV